METKTRRVAAMKVNKWKVYSEEQKKIFEKYGYTEEADRKVSEMVEKLTPWA